ncbi:metallophosphoesterase [Salininema proteolyticum]|uniref:Metallophosphoesterase n=1 Tax=Salininema proteolyticum TaxID=1607685 RepID=A0ABV8U4F0_9ACTN
MTSEYFWFILRLTAVTAGFAVLHLYIWHRLVATTLPKGSAARRCATAALALLLILGLAARLLVPSEAPMWLQKAVGWPGHLWFGFVIYLLALLVLAEPLRWWWNRRGGREPANARTQPETEPEAARAHKDTVTDTSSAEADREPAPESASTPGTGSETEAEAPPGLPRRTVISRAIAIGTVGATSATVGYGSYEAWSKPRVRTLEIPVDRLPASADGYRIAVVGDLELGAFRGREFCRRIVEQVNGTSPDMIAVVGDLVNNSVEQLESATEPLAGLAARDGSYFVTGNHEHYVGAQQWIDRVADLGVMPLPNQRVELPGFDLAGVNDLAVQKRQLEGEVGPDLSRALGGRDPDRASVLLAHQPDIVRHAMDWSVDLQLSGHSHGGQMWPNHFSAAMSNIQVDGLDRYDGTRLYVTNGVGTSGPPLRIGAPPEIAVVTLRSPGA